MELHKFLYVSSILCLLYTCSIHIYLQDISLLKKPKKMQQIIQICPCFGPSFKKLFSTKLWTVSSFIFYFYECQVSYNRGDALLVIFAQIHGPNISKSMIVTVYLLVLVNCLCAFQVYVMVVFDNFEGRYTSKKNQPCTLWVHTCIRVGYGGLAFFL